MKPTTNPLSSPFQQLEVLAERVKLSGSLLPKEIDSSEQWSGIKCRFIDKDYVLKLEEVAEVLDSASVSPIPGSASWIKGVVNLRGRLLPIYGLDEYFTGQRGDFTIGQIIVVENAQLFCGFAAQKIYGMKKYYRKNFCDDGDSGGMDKLSKFITFKARDSKQDGPVLSILALANMMFRENPALEQKDRSALVVNG